MFIKTLLKYLNFCSKQAKIWSDKGTYKLVMVINVKIDKIIIKYTVIWIYDRLKCLSAMQIKSVSWTSVK